MNANLQAALALASAGYFIFPAGANKRPLVRQWQTADSADPARIKAWWQTWPEALPALPTGRRNRIAVLDIDRRPGKDGFAGLAGMGLDSASLSYVAVETPSGGLHLYFSWPEGLGNSATGLPPGCDVRGEGGNVMAEGATGPQGSYRARSGNGLVDDMFGLPDWPEALRP